MLCDEPNRSVREKDADPTDVVTPGELPAAAGRGAGPEVLRAGGTRVRRTLEGGVAQGRVRWSRSEETHFIRITVEYPASSVAVVWVRGEFVGYEDDLANQNGVARPVSCLLYTSDAADE